MCVYVDSKDLEAIWLDVYDVQHNNSTPKH